MAIKLLNYFDEAKKIGGIKAQLRLAVRTKIPSPRARELPDSDENIRLFEEAMMEIKKEFN